VMEVRDAEPSEIDQVAKVLHEAWNDAHAHLVPGELVRLRTLEHFRERVEAELPKFRVVGPPGDPLGLYMNKDDELDLLFVARRARGTGVAATLIADAEARLAETGVETAWLACMIGNERAARFYEKCGWRRTGTTTNFAETPSGTFALEVWRYEKVLKSQKST
jgi:GNAT superfamily N-acetyltransferase